MGSVGAIYGIPCTVRCPALKRAIRKVLRQVRERAPGDFGRMREKVLRVSPLPRRELADGTVGEWRHVARLPARLDPVRARRRMSLEGWIAAGYWRYEMEQNWPGTILLWDPRRGEEAPEWRLVANVAHEFGHAATSHEDTVRRGREIDAEWATEGCADYYAYKWGFGRQIARARRTRRMAHHGPGPGEVFEFCGARIKLTRSFCLRVLDD